MKLCDSIAGVLRREGTEVWPEPPDAPVFEAVVRISERDYARKVVLAGRSSTDTFIREIMTHPVITVAPTATVDERMRLMTNSRIRPLPVIDGQRIACMISTGDLVQWIISAHEVMVEQLNNYITGHNPA